MPHDGSPEGQAQPASLDTIEKCIPVDYRWVRRAIHEVEEELLEARVTKEDIGSISIVLAEAMNNVVEHAFEDNQGEKITLIVRKRSKSLIVEIRDSGRPMPKSLT